MVEQFLNHIQRHKLCKTTDKILLAVSGGVDSMVMLDLFAKAGFTIAVAHCNFKLRGTDSDEDEDFVAHACEAYNISCFIDHFNTATIATENQQSIQVAARELRYSFFDRLLKQQSFDCVATAHQLNDNLETVLLNLVRGTGLDGIAGIPLRNGHVIRPLLFASREMVLSYARQNSVRWREDRSNLENDYSRNLIRNLVIPEFKKINPGLESAFHDTAERITAMHGLAQSSLNHMREETIDQKRNQLLFSRKKIMAYDYPEVILWELVKHHGFNYDQCRLMVKEHQSGKIFESPVAIITIDRNSLILEEKNGLALLSVNIDESDRDVTNGEAKLHFSQHAIDGYSIRKDPLVAQLDADKINFPLTWRPWRAGDAMVPFGMKSKKKVSDLLVDARIPLPDKRRISVLECSGEIVWLVGLRIDDRYKVTSATEQVIIVECLPA